MTGKRDFYINKDIFFAQHKINSHAELTAVNNHYAD